jgi:hypothetical protein
MTGHISIIVTTICLLLGSCSVKSDKKHIPEGFSKLTVIVDDNSNFYLDKVSVSNSNKEFKLTMEYDTIRKKPYYLYDSLRNNEYQIVLTSLVNRNFKIPITLTSDSTTFSAIYINKGNKLFVLTSAGINEIPYHSDFMRALKL